MPAEGIALSTLFPGIDPAERAAGFNQAGQPYGLTFAVRTHVSNSRKALLMSELARDKGKFHEFHDAVFRAYFADNKDIGNVNVLYEIGNSVGLAQDDLLGALEDSIYTDRLAESMKAAQEYEVTAVPTFIVADKFKLVGAQSIDVFRKKLREI